MKIRNGFVSNSSSSSFLIYGTTMFRDEILKTLNTKHKEVNEEDDDSDDVYEVLEEALEGTKLDHHTPYDDSVYIGASWDAIGDDETGAQFKQRVQDQLKKVFGKELPCGTQSEAWHD